MTIKKLLCSLGLVSVAIFSANVNATVLNFNELTTANSFDPVHPYSSNGYSITNSRGTPDALGVWGANMPEQADPGNAALLVIYPDSTTTLARTNNGLFTLNSIDFADVYNTGNSYVIRFDFFDVVNQITSQTIVLDQLIGLETFTFNLTGLSKVEWTTVNGSYSQFDNIVLDEDLSAVPLPAAAPLLLSALGLFGIASRRKK